MTEQDLRERSFWCGPNVQWAKCLTGVLDRTEGPAKVYIALCVCVCVLNFEINPFITNLKGFWEMLLTTMTASYILL